MSHGLRVKTEYNSTGDQSKRKLKENQAKAFEQQLFQLANKPASEIQRWIDQQFSGDSDSRAAMGTVMSRICRNCLMGGRGVVQHSRADCERLGNPPTEPCNNCLKQGKGTHFHWRSQCSTY